MHKARGKKSIFIAQLVKLTLRNFLLHRNVLLVKLCTLPHKSVLLFSGACKNINVYIAMTMKNLKCILCVDLIDTHRGQLMCQVSKGEAFP